MSIIRLFVRLLTIATLAHGAQAQTYTFTTLAGSTGFGSADGTGNAARFNNPYGVAVDSAGNVYVADTGNHTVRKMTAAGVVTTLAGKAGASGYLDGTGSSARFASLAGIALDAAGNIYVADSSAFSIRKITPAGSVSTFAGRSGSVNGSTDGTGSNARFSNPRGVAVDKAGNVYVADQYNHTIRKISPAAAVTTLAGLAGQPGSANGTGNAARFRFPWGVGVDTAGNIYVADTGNYMIRKITPGGVVTTVAGSVASGGRGSLDGTGAAAGFAAPYSLALNSADEIYVADSLTLRKVTAAGVVTTLAGSAGLFGFADGSGADARFGGPTAGLGVDPSGNIFLADTPNHTIRKVTASGVVTTLAGVPGGPGSLDGTGSGARFNYPRGVTVDADGNVFVADSSNNSIRKVTPAGVVTSPLRGLVSFNSPAGVAVDRAGNLYVAAAFSGSIDKVTPEGELVTLAGQRCCQGSADGIGSKAAFSGPQALALDDAGNVYVADTGNKTIRKVTPDGVVTTIAGRAGSSGSADGVGTAARFYDPSGIAVDASGNLYVADTGNDTIRKITLAGVVTTFAGVAAAYGSADGIGTAARFFHPGTLATDTNGNIYVADVDNQAIRKITPSGAVTTVGGNTSIINEFGFPTPGLADGPGNTARFNYPYGVAVDLSGNLYVADRDNHIIRKGTAITIPSLRARLVSNQLLISWPASASDFILERRSSLRPSSTWTPITNALVTLDGNLVLTNTLDPSVGFFRLRQP